MDFKAQTSRGRHVFSTLGLAGLVLSSTATGGLAACSSSNSAVAPPHDNVPAKQDASSQERGEEAEPSTETPSTETTCMSGSRCTCGDGRSGKTACSFGKAACECDNCPQFVAPTPVPFEACGGDVLGAWVFDHAETSNMQLEIYGRNFSALLGTCPSVLQSDPKGSEFASGVVELLQDGEAHVKFRLGQFKFAVDEACVQGVLGRGCAAFGDECTTRCGICECNGKSKSVEGDYVKWKQTSNTFDVTGSVGESLAGEYCVRGDTLALKLERGSGLILNFRQFPYYSSKTPCAARTPDECRSTSGCQLGVCTGPAECEPNFNNWACSSRTACKFQANTCVDSTTPACSATSVGVDPGCLPADGKVCVGTATSCSQVSGNACTAQVGCTKLTPCYRPFACDFYAMDYEVCSNVGCRWHPDQGCIETEEPCSVYRTKDMCTAFSGCYYDASRSCDGTAKPCSSLTLSECSHQAGCSIVSSSDAGVDAPSAAKPL